MHEAHHLPIWHILNQADRLLTQAEATIRYQDPELGEYWANAADVLIGLVRDYYAAGGRLNRTEASTLTALEQTQHDVWHQALDAQDPPATSAEQKRTDPTGI